MIVYDVNTKKRVVVARFFGNEDYWRNCLSESISAFCNRFGIGFTIAKRVDYIKYGMICVHGNLAGIARCHELDEFDIEKGKQIAKAKLLYRWRIAKFNMVLKMLKDRESEDKYLCDVLQKTAPGEWSGYTKHK